MVPRVSPRFHRFTICPHGPGRPASPSRGNDGEFTRVSQKVHPGWSRYYARVLKEGIVTTGDRVVLVPARLLF